MTPLIQRVIKWADITFSSAVPIASRDHDKSFAANMTKLLSEVTKLRSSDVTTSSGDFSFDEDRGSLFRRLLRPSSSGGYRGAPVAYAEILENDSFTVGMFVLRRAGARIPLHDHPEMHGIIKVVHGAVTVDSYTAVGFGSRSTIRVKRLPQLVVDADSEPCCLSPDAGNFHEIKAVNGPAAFVDILAPPYDHSSYPGRLCRFYRCERTSAIDSASAFDAILIECNQPSDFWSDNIPYTGPEVHI